MGVRKCGYFVDADMTLNCTDERKCEECKLAPLFASLIRKGEKAGKAEMDEAINKLWAEHRTAMANMERLQNQFCVHDMMGRPVLITGSEVICAKEAKIGTDTIIVTTKGKVRCREPLEIVESKRKGTYDLY